MLRLAFCHRGNLMEYKVVVDFMARNFSVRIASSSEQKIAKHSGARSGGKVISGDKKARFG